MNKDHLFTARWNILENKPVPEGGPRDEVLDLLATVLGPAPQDTTPEVPPPSPGPSEPPAPSPGSGARKKVALVVGHNSKAPGAYVGPLSEYAFNGSIAELIKKLNPAEFEVQVFYRYASSSYAAEIDACYAKVNQWNPDFSVEMHFNGGGGNYSMMVYAPGSAKGLAASQAMVQTFGRVLGIPVWSGGSPKGSGCEPRDRTKNGGRSVMATRCPAILTEPFFGDHSVHRATVEKLGVAGMARLYIDAIASALRVI